MRPGFIQEICLIRDVFSCQDISGWYRRNHENSKYMMHWSLKKPAIINARIDPDDYKWAGCQETGLSFFSFPGFGSFAFSCLGSFFGACCSFFTPGPFISLYQGFFSLMTSFRRFYFFNLFVFSFTGFVSFTSLVPLPLWVPLRFWFLYLFGSFTSLGSFTLWVLYLFGPLPLWFLYLSGFLSCFSFWPLWQFLRVLVLSTSLISLVSLQE